MQNINVLSKDKTMYLVNLHSNYLLFASELLLVRAERAQAGCTDGGWKHMELIQISSPKGNKKEISAI